MNATSAPCGPALPPASAPDPTRQEAARHPEEFSQPVAWPRLVALNFGWFAEVYNALLHGVGLTFAARRFTDDPRALALVATLGLLCSGLVGPVVNYLCDGVRTRFGRRRPVVAGAYLLSGAGLVFIPLMDGLPSLLAAAAIHAFLHALASPWESLYMELVPAEQQGRSQALRQAMVHTCVLFFFQLVLVQFGDPFPLVPAWGARHGLTGVHLAYWVGAGLLTTMGTYLALRARERPLGPAVPRPPGLFPAALVRDVLGNPRWRPAFAVYVAPVIVGGVWSTFQPLMTVEELGFSITEMARLGLPGSLSCVILVAPLLGYATDRPRLPGPKALAVVACALALLAALALPGLVPPDGSLPPFWRAACVSVPACGAAVIGLLALASVPAFAARESRLRARLILSSLGVQALLAGCAAAWALGAGEGVRLRPIGSWLIYLSLTQCLGLAATVSVMPLLFSRIPPERFGTVSAGFGFCNAAVGFSLAHLGGAWVHGWDRAAGGAGTPYSSLWLLQVVAALSALVLTGRALRSPLLRDGP